jgi:hypothetical protein
MDMSLLSGLGKLISKIALSLPSLLLVRSQDLAMGLGVREGQFSKALRVRPCGFQKETEGSNAPNVAFFEQWGYFFGLGNVQVEGGDSTEDNPRYLQCTVPTLILAKEKVRLLNLNPANAPQFT